MECEPPGRLKLWIYDLRTNKHFTLKENPLKRSDLDDFVACWFGVESAVSAEKPGKISAGDSRRYSGNRHERIPADRFRSFTYEELTKRDKLNLDIFWLKDASLKDSANLPDPDIIAQEIVKDLEAALSQFATIAQDLKK